MQILAHRARSLSAALVVLFVGAWLSSCATTAQNLPGMPTMLTQVKSQPELSRFLSLSKLAAFDEDLNGAKTLTVFAPTNTAFDQLGREQYNKLVSDRTRLRRVLWGHVVEDELTPKELAGAYKKTRNLNGGQMVVTIHPDSTLAAVNDAEFVSQGTLCSNGYLYVINEVLLPDNF